MDRRLLLLFVAPILIVLAACAPTINLLDENNLKDTSLLSGEPCEAPCWNGIVPGETSFRDAKIIVEDDVRYLNVDEVEPDEETNSRLFGFSDGEANICCQVLSEDGEVIESLLFLLAPEMTLDAILDKYGAPTYLAGDSPAEDQAVMFLIYPDVSIVIYAFVAGATEGELSDTSEIIGVLYLTDDGMQQLINTNSFYEWDGYQSFATYIDENYDFVGEEVGSSEDASSGESESNEND
jgi:hypothetical protein